MARDYYDVLGVGRNASPEEIQAAYRRQARANHPDVNRDPAAEDRDTVAVREFNQALRDDERVDISLLPMADGITLIRRRRGSR